MTEKMIVCLRFYWRKLAFSGGTAGYQIYENLFKKIDISGIQFKSTYLLGF